MLRVEELYRVVFKIEFRRLVAEMVRSLVQLRSIGLNNSMKCYVFEGIKIVQLLSL